MGNSTKTTRRQIGPDGLVLAVMALFNWTGDEAQEELRAVAPAAERVARELATYCRALADEPAISGLQALILERYRQALTEEHRRRVEGDDHRLSDLADGVAWHAGDLGLLAGLVAGWHLRDRVIGGGR